MPSTAQTSTAKTSAAQTSTAQKKAIQKAEGFPKSMASLDVSAKAKAWKLSPDGIRMIEAAMRKAKRAI